MILQTSKDLGFLRHKSLNWKLYDKKSKNLLIKSFERNIIISTLSNYAIPSRVAPQQSSSPLYVTVKSNILNLNYFLTLSFPHLNE